MRKDWETPLERWTLAGLIDQATAGRIREFEEARTPAQRFRWPVFVALGFGTILLAAGVLLFVSAHWDQLSPGERLSIVLLIIAAFHAGGALAAGRFEGLSISLHTIGTIALGAGIALAGQIYHLSEHWPSAILLWAVGAGRRVGTVTAVAAGSADRHPRSVVGGERVVVGFARFERTHSRCDWSVCACVHVSHVQSQREGLFRTRCAWLAGRRRLDSDGGVGCGSPVLVPDYFRLVFQLAVAVDCDRYSDRAGICAARASRASERSRYALGRAPSVLSVGDYKLAIYFWCFVGAVGLASGIRERHAERVNLAFLGFAVTVLVFYFSDVMAKLDRAFSLIVLGVLFLGGGWLLERTRRKVIARMRTAPA